jgi:chemotaxis protein MotB
MADDNAPPIIVKKIKKGDHGAHHGGAWKVAYADFVTAMMAFFLLLWLLNATTEEQKRGIAEYFSPLPGAMGQTTGGTGLFAGNTVTADGRLTDDNAQVGVTVPLPVTELNVDKTEGEDEKMAAPDKEAGKNGPTDEAQDAVPPVNEAEAEKLVAEKETQRFQEAENMLRQAIQSVPDLKDLAENLIMDNTPEGLRIQIVDQEKYAMFPRGSSAMESRAKLLMQKIAEVLTKFPEKISVSGHTDSVAYADGKKYDNWDLSTDRANASRRVLIDTGLAPARIVNLAGKADTEPLVKDDPSSPKNRRISIVLLREKPLPAPGGKPAGAAPQPGQPQKPPEKAQQAGPQEARKP